MHVQIKTALAVLFLASVPLHLRASQVSSEPLSAKGLRQAEATAKTAADHLRLAVYYQTQAQQTQAKLAEAEDQVKHYSFMADRTKVPNAYTSSKTLADRYRYELEKDTKLAAEHKKMAETLQAGIGG
jgi:hypothetical protein